MNDRHVFHILIFKQKSYSYTCDMLSLFRIFAMMLGRCYSMTVEYHRERMVINEQAADEPQESPL